MELPSLSTSCTTATSKLRLYMLPLAGMRHLSSCRLCPQHFNDINPLSSGLHSSLWKVFLNKSLHFLIFVYLYVLVHWLLFKDYSFYYWFSVIWLWFTLVYMGEGFYCAWGLLNYLHQSIIFIKLDKSLVFIFLNAFVPLSSFWDFNYIYVRHFDIIP